MSQRIEFKVGLFITITTVLIMASIGYVFYQKGIFARVHTYTLSSKTGETLAEGMRAEGRCVDGGDPGRAGQAEAHSPLA